ncbi:MAG: hypothetical protein ACTSXV_01055, partial [Alphaproteobacteria bacterium]
YVFTFLGLIGLALFFTKIRLSFLSEKMQLFLTGAFFIIGAGISFYLSSLHFITLITIGSAIALGLYVSFLQPGLLSLKSVKTGLCMSFFFASLAILDMPAQYLLPQMGNISFLDKIIFVFLIISAVLSLIANFPFQKGVSFKFQLSRLVFFGLSALTLSAIILFLFTESPTGLVLVGGGTLFSGLFFKIFLIQTKIEKEAFVFAGNLLFGSQFLWLGMLLGYTPLLILGGILCGIYASEAKILSPLVKILK